MRELFIIFFSIFVAEVGDKTQLATMLFATDNRFSKVSVFVVSSAALVSATFLAVLVGNVVTRFVPESTLKTLAGFGFILVGLWTLLSASR